MKPLCVPLLLAALTVTACDEGSTPTALTDDIPLPSMAVVAYDCSLQTQIPQAECGALVALYNGTGGLDWTDKNELAGSLRTLRVVRRLL